MSITSNFDFCIELGLESVKQIFHLALKNEHLFPHTLGPFTRTLSGHDATVNVSVLDDNDRPANLSFQDPKHLLFDIPFDIHVEIPSAPDPSLSMLTISATANVPGRLDSWSDSSSGNPNPVLGVSFSDITPAAVGISSLTGVPSIGVANMLSAIHSKYDALPHVYTQPSAYGGINKLNLYDGTRDTTLLPPLPGNPQITATLNPHGTDQYLHVSSPISVHIPGPGGFNYDSFGHLDFNRLVTTTDTTVTVDMATEPTDPTLKTVVVLDNTAYPHDLVVAQIQPQAVGAISGFGSITEPAFTSVAARALLQQEIANYLQPLSYAVYSPQSGDPTQPLATPVGFLLVATGALAILLNRRTGTVADDVAPDDFLSGDQLALAVSAQKVIERSDAVIRERFPGVNNGGAEIHTKSGDATLKHCHAAPEDSGQHGDSPGHLWVTGDATVHIPCWPDPDVSFEGPVYIDATRVDTADGCTLDLQPRAGKFNVSESCCDVLLDLLIPVVGWIMLVVIEGTINSVGGELATDVANQEAKSITPFPPVVLGIAQVSGCLTGLNITGQGFIFPGEVKIRRLGTSFDDRKQENGLPRPGQP